MQICNGLCCVVLESARSDQEQEPAAAVSGRASDSVCTCLWVFVNLSFKTAEAGFGSLASSWGFVVAPSSSFCSAGPSAFDRKICTHGWKG